MEEKLSITIPRASEKEVVNIPKGDIGDFKEKTNRRFEKIDNLLFGVIAAVVVSGVAVVVSVIGIFLDQMRYNNAAYREYSDKVTVSEQTQNINRELLEQNEKNQEIIIQQQKQVLELLDKLSKSQFNGTLVPKQ